MTEFAYLHQRENKDGKKLSSEQANNLRRAGIEYVAAVALYNDLDARLTVNARPFAERPWEVYSTETEEWAARMAEKREEAIMALAKAKTKFVEVYVEVFGKKPGA